MAIYFRGNDNKNNQKRKEAKKLFFEKTGRRRVSSMTEKITGQKPKKIGGYHEKISSYY